jgi:hypothetical protein
VALRAPRLEDRADLFRKIHLRRLSRRSNAKADHPGCERQAVAANFAQPPRAGAKHPAHLADLVKSLAHRTLGCPLRRIVPFRIELPEALTNKLSNARPLGYILATANRHCPALFFEEFPEFGLVNGDKAAFARR